MERVKLNYVSAVRKTPPVRKVPVSSCKMESLDRSICEKVRANKVERAASKEMASHYLVR